MCLFDFTIMHSFGHRSKIEYSPIRNIFISSLTPRQSCQLTFESSLPPINPCTHYMMFSLPCHHSLVSIVIFSITHCNEVVIKIIERVLKKKLLQLLIAKVPCSVHKFRLRCILEIIKTVENYYCFIFLLFFLSILRTVVNFAN